MACCCCGGPSVGPCLSTLCNCTTTYQYTFALDLIGGGSTPPGSSTNHDSNCCPNYNRTYTMSRIAGSLGSPQFVNCIWRDATGTGGGCTIQKYAMMFEARSDNPNIDPAHPCRVYMEFTFNPIAFASAYVSARYYCDTFDCESGGTFVLLDNLQCTGWPASIVMTKVP